MNGYALHPASGRQSRECHQMIVVRMDAAFADQTNEVERAVPGAIACINQRRELKERATLDRSADAHEVLHHDATGPEVEVTDLGIPDLPFGESDRETRGIDERARQRFPEGPPRRDVAERDGVCRAFGAIPPPVENDEHYSSTRALSHLCRRGVSV
jgi:hypothetical protein